MRFFDTVFAEKKVALDALDKKILAELARNARSSQSAIAKRIHTSRDTVNYRVANLKKSGVLQAFRTVVNIAQFGFLNMHVFLQLKQPTKEVFAALVKKLKEYPYVRAIIQFNGKYDLELALVAKDIYECDKVVGEVCNACADVLQNVEVLFITKTLAAHTFPKSFVSCEFAQEQKKSKEETHLDRIDIEILELLAEHADIPIYRIAQQVGLSADAVTYRVKKLQKSEYILGYVPAVNYALINYQVHAILIRTTNMTRKDEAAVEEFVRTNKDVLWAVKMLGKYQLLFYICTQKLDDFLKTTEDIRSLLTNKISDYETLVNFEEYKYTYLPKGLLEKK